MYLKIGDTRIDIAGDIKMDITYENDNFGVNISNHAADFKLHDYYEQIKDEHQVTVVSGNRELTYFNLNARYYFTSPSTEVIFFNW